MRGESDLGYICDMFPKSRTAPSKRALLLGLIPLFFFSAGIVGAYIWANHVRVENSTAAADRIINTPDSQLPDDDSAPSTTAPSTAAQEVGMTPGLPFKDPADLNTQTPAHITLNLLAENQNFSISGKSIWGDGYDGQFVGPTLHVVPGEYVTLTLTNKLGSLTNLHFHGLHLSPSGNQDNPYINVDPSHSFTYELKIPKNQPIGTFWYHDHDMCAGDETMNMSGSGSMNMNMSAQIKWPKCADVESQIFAGLSGTIIVGDDRELLPAQYRNITAHTIVLKDLQIDSNGDIVENTDQESINSNNPSVRLVNGELQPVLAMKPGETQLWRLANEGADIFYNLNMPGYSFTIIGQDGYPSTKVTTAQNLLLPPGKRYDVLVTAPEKPAQAWLQTLAFKEGEDLYPQVNLMQLRVAGAPVKALSNSEVKVTALPGSLSSENLASATIAQHRTVTLSETADGNTMFINGNQFDRNKPAFATPAKVGTVEEWTILNTTKEIHPFHTHADHFQVMSINGVAQPYIGEQDEVPVPAESHGVPGKAVIRIHFTDFTGQLMFHCHIAAHEDAGMMSFINVVK